MKFTGMTHTPFAIMMLFFHKVSVIFNKLLPTLSKTLYTDVVKFPTSTSEHITIGTSKLNISDNACVEFFLTET
jgi:hypothetical protein